MHQQSSTEFETEKGEYGGSDIDAEHLGGFFAR